jgi:hypothetical protein
MRGAIALLVVASVPAAAQLTKAAQITKASAPVSGASAMGSLGNSKIALGTFLPLEKRFNQQLARLFDANEPLDLLGLTRGVYLEGYGVVFTAEVSLVVTPSKSPFLQNIPKELADRVRQRKIERLPFLKAAMKEMMRTAANTFMQIPTDQKVVIAIRFLYEPWEDRTGMPSQITMTADRKSAMAGDVQVEEQ